ncbi:CcdB family protein [Aquabacterium sp.]|uniref:CcdB family protein n=1 Tax=Aquabacterium sp. TaxID=1872578 RepID=UPI002BEE7CF4|nr:CcdB family protein [Aquabacterium sp.]HSW08658.1 CcdB family protein [Aquabacterium sp.]
MARYDVHANPTPAERKHTPYLLDVQNDYIDGLLTRVVIPLRREAVFGPRARNLHPMFQVKADNVVLDTTALGAVPAAALRAPVANLHAHRAEVQEALDTLFGAF